MTSIAICAKSFLFEIKLSLIGSVPGIAANCGPTVQSVDLGRGEWNDPFIIIIVRSSRTWNGTAPGRVPNLGKIICQYFWGALTFRSRDILVKTFLYIKKTISFVCLNYYRGRWNVTSSWHTNSLWCCNEVTKQFDSWNLTLIGVVPTWFKYVCIKLNIKIMRQCWLTRIELAYGIFVLWFQPEKQQFSVASPTP